MTRIEMTGADEAHYRSAMERQSRAIVFPDGLSRHVTLTNWQWEAFDRAQEQVGSTWLVTAIYRHALRRWLKESFRDAADSVDAGARAADTHGPARFERRLRHSLHRMIHVAMPSVTGCGEAAND